MSRKNKPKATTKRKTQRIFGPGQVEREPHKGNTPGKRVEQNALAESFSSFVDAILIGRKR